MRWMGQSRPAGRSGRRGAVIVMVALMLVVLFACTALCIDIGWATLAKSELQNAADASAAAGAIQLQAKYGPYLSATSATQTALVTSVQTSASAESTRFAGYHSAGGVPSLTLPSGDVQFGFTNASGSFTANAPGYPNTVQVVTRRDQAANAPLAFFFGPFLGKSHASLTATARATVYSGLITGFDPDGGGEGTGGGPSGWSDDSASPGAGGEVAGGTSGGWGDDYASAGNFACKLLPIAFDVNSWNQFISTGQSPDGTIRTDESGVRQVKVYPSPQNSPGNFGLLCIGPWTNANPQYSSWILNGPTGSDLQTLMNEGKFPVSQSAPKNWKGSPGLRTALRSDFTQIIGQPRLLPLFKPANNSPYQAASGSGSNTTYAIVGFVGVKVTVASGAGNNLEIAVQPCDVIDPTAVFDSATLYPAGAEPAGQLKSFTHPSVKFTR